MNEQFQRLDRRQLFHALTAIAVCGPLTEASILSAATVDSSIINKFLGDWKYRSFRNVATPVQNLDDILFWEADLKLFDKGGNVLAGTIGDGTDSLTVKGSATFGFPNYIRFEANGIAATGSAGWKYNYIGFLVPDWPDGANQVDAIVGTVIRTVEHSNGKAKAGYVASFVAVRVVVPPSKQT